MNNTQEELKEIILEYEAEWQYAHNKIDESTDELKKEMYEIIRDMFSNLVYKLKKLEKYNQ